MNPEHPFRRWLRILGPVLGMGLFIVALFVLHRALQHYRYRDLKEVLSQMPAWRILLAAGVTVLSYLVLTGYDTLAMRYIRHALPYRKTALASFAGYAFSHNLGLAFFSGAAVRLRLYGVWGLSALDVAKVAAFNSFTFWLGWSAIAGSAFMLSPGEALGVLPVPEAVLRLAGLLMVLSVPAYIVLCARRSRPFVIAGWEIELPTARIALIQLLLSASDWVLAGAVLYVLLPGVQGYLPVLFCFLFAVPGGVISQVPGGLGVFESVVLFLLSPQLPVPGILAGLLVFRGVYYLLPLGAAALLLGLHELMLRRKGVLKALNLVGRWFPVAIPQVLAATTFIAGAVLVVSGAIPRIGWRIELLRGVVPLPVVELAHFLASVTGVALLLLAPGIQKRVHSAYRLTVGLLFAGMLFSMVKGLDFEETVILGLILIALLPCRKQFHRRGAFLSRWLTPAWAASIALIFVASIWLGLFSYKHAAFRPTLWWRFSLRGDAPRFMRATAGMLGATLLLAMWQLVRPLRGKRGVQAVDGEQIRALAARHPGAYAHLALLGDKQFLFNGEKSAFIMYAHSGRCFIAMGDPVGGYRDQEDLAWDFKDHCDRRGARTVFFLTDQSRMPLYLDLGLSLLKLGEEARVRLQDFSPEGADLAASGDLLRGMEEKGLTFEVVPASEIRPMLPELKRISDEWLAASNSGERFFASGSFRDDYLACFPCAVVRLGGRLTAFADLWGSLGREELAADMMRHLPSAPEGITEYMHLRLMRWGQAQGYHWYNLGLSPAPLPRGVTHVPPWSEIGDLRFRAGTGPDAVQDARRFKEQFKPVWIPKYLACPGGLALHGVMTDLAALLSGGPEGHSDLRGRPRA
jgi:phosphatidylglycerol lysyltransferase